MTAIRRESRAFRTLALAGALSIGLGSCALFKPEKVSVRSFVEETLPPRPIAGPATPGQPGALPTGAVVFQPGSSRNVGGKQNYASDDGVTPDVIRLGTIQPMDGPAAQLGKPLYRATQAYVNDLNARGGINGRKVELYLQTACINCEAENKLAAQALVEQKHVFALVNTYMNTYAFSAALTYLNERKVPLIEGWSGAGSEGQVWGSQQTPWNVYYTVRNPDGVAVFANFLRAAVDKWRQANQLPFPEHPYWVATVGLKAAQDIRRAQEFKKLWESFGPDYKVVVDKQVEANEETLTRMDSEVDAMRNAHANAAFSASNATMIFGMQAAERRGWKVPWVAKSAWGRAATDTCGPSCEGGFTDNNGWGWPELDTPQMRQYHQVMAKYYPDSTDDAQTYGGWIGMMAFEYAASRLGADLTRGGLMNILTSLRNFETGIGATINTSSSDHLGMAQTMMLQICNNRFYRVSGWLGPSTAPPAEVKTDCGWGY